MSLQLHIPPPSLLKRLPRSLAESPAVFPDWRYQQAYIYDMEARTSQRYTLLSQEDDRLTTQLYAFMRHGTSGSRDTDRHLQYAIDAEEYNGRFGAAARIKSYVLANLSHEEIADRMGCAPETIEVFEKIFFDVRDKRLNLDYIVSIIYPLVVPREETAITRRERFLMIVAWLFGIEGFDITMRRKIDISEATQKMIMSRVYSLSSSAALNFQISREARCSPQPEDHDRLVSLSMIPKNEEGAGEARIVDFARGFAGDVSSKLGIHLDPKKQVLTRYAEVEVRTRECRMRLTQGSDDPHIIDLTRPPQQDNFIAGNSDLFSIK